MTHKIVQQETTYNNDRYSLRLLASLFISIYILGFQNCSSLFKTQKVAEIKVPEIVRVRIGTMKEPFQIEADGAIRITNASKKEVIDSAYAYYPEEFNSGDRLFLEPKKGKFKFSGKEYRGTLEIFRTPKDVLVINHLSLEDYLLSVVPSEMPPTWQLEALKAQAVAARTYATYHITNSKAGLYDLETDTNSQVYSGIKAENPNSTKAVRETMNQIMVYNNRPIKAFFHSHSGGVTESPEKYGAKKWII